VAAEITSGLMATAPPLVAGAPPSLPLLPPPTPASTDRTQCCATQTSPLLHVPSALQVPFSEPLGVVDEELHAPQKTSPATKLLLTIANRIECMFLSPSMDALAAIPQAALQQGEIHTKRTLSDRRHLCYSCAISTSMGKIRDFPATLLPAESTNRIIVLRA